MNSHGYIKDILKIYHHGIFLELFGNKLYVYSSYKDVLKHVGKTKIDLIQQIKKNDILKYQNQYLGKWRKNIHNALWTKSLLENAHNLTEIPENFDKVIVAVDPAASTNKNSDETGIIVCGYSEGMYYILEQKTGKYTPYEWACIVRMLYEKYKANAVVAEVNMGGDLVQANIRNVCGNFIYVQKIHASKGKILRAEPVSALYQQNKVKHIKIFEQLQLQMLTYTGNAKQKSPNSLDAMVHGITYLTENLRARQQWFLKIFDIINK